MSTNLSGKSGKVMAGATAIASITEWNFDEETDVDQFATSDSGGYKLAVPGVQHGQGSFTYKRDSSAAFGVTNGQSVTLALYEDATHSWSVPAIIKNRKVKVDINTGAAVGGSCDFVSNGEWTAIDFTS